MSDLAASIVMEAAAMRAKRTHAKQKQAAKDSARHKRTNARIARNVAKRKRAPKGSGTCKTAPWNKMTPESEMKLFLCESVRQTLYRLECAEYEAKHGK